MIRNILCLSFMASVFLSFDLWRSTRAFPVLPVFRFFEYLPSWVADVALNSLLVLLILGFFFRKSYLFVLICGLIVLFAMADQMRIQPWVYFYALMFLPFVFDSQNKLESFVAIYIKWIFVAIYFWSGLHKLNVAFYQLSFPNIVDSFLPFGENPIIEYVYKLGPAVGMIEILTALLLLVPHLRRFGALLGIACHLFIIIYLSRISYNAVVLPWNICMLSILALLFLRKDFRAQTTFGIKALPSFLMGVVIVVWFILAYNYFTGSAHNFAFSLYSRKTDHYLVEFSVEKDSGALSDFKPYWSGLSRYKNRTVLNVQKYSLGELNVPFYPSERTFKQFARKLCKEPNDSAPLKFIQLDQLQTKEPKIFICDEVED